MKKLLLILLFPINYFSFAQNNLNTQVSISGNIKDENKTPLDFAQIVALSDSKKTLAYTNSNENGYYVISFNVDADSVLLSISRLGYNTEIRKVSVNVKNINFKLNESSNSKLDEIIVTDNEKPIMEMGDTVSYLARSFTDGTEVNVADVLTKLPGLTVDQSSGQIKYQGKEISKIFLDGDDLADNNYKVISQNLSAQWLEKIEILKHFSDRRLLKGIEQTNEIAINLKLKESAKSPLFGSITIAGGNTKKYLVESEVLSYLKKLKMLTIAQANNSGDELQSYSVEAYNSAKMEYKGFIISDKIIDNKLSAPGFLSEENFTFQEGQFASQSMLFKPTPKLNIRTMTNLYNNNINFNFIDSTKFFIPDSKKFTLYENQIQNQKPFNIFQDIKLDYQINNNSNLSSVCKFKHDATKLLSYNSINNKNLEENTNINQIQMYGNVSYTKKFSEKCANITELQISIDDNKELIDFQLNNSTNKNIINQTYTQKYINYGVSNNFQTLLKNNLHINILSACTHTFGNLLINNHFKELIYEKATNKIEYSLNNYFIEPRFTKKIKRLSLTASARFRLAHISVFQKEKNILLVEPLFSIKAKEKLFNLLTTEIKLLYNTEYTFLKPHTLNTNRVFTSYKSSISYSADAFTPIKNNLYVATLEIRENDYSLISAYAQFAYSHSSNDFIQDFDYSDYCINSRMEQNEKNQSFISRYSVDKFFSRIRTNIKLMYEYEYNFIPISLDNKLINNKMYNSDFKIAIGCALIRKTSISLSYSYKKLVNTISENNNKFSYSKYITKINYKPIQKLRLVFDFRFVNFKELGYNYFVSTYIMYEIPKRKLNFKLSVNNLFNASYMKLQNIESTFSSISYYPIHKRFFMLALTYRFSTNK